MLIHIFINLSFFPADDKAVSVTHCPVFICYRILIPHDKIIADRTVAAGAFPYERSVDLTYSPVVTVAKERQHMKKSM